MTTPSPSGRLRVVVADDHTLFRDGLRALLDAVDIDVVADVPSGHDVPGVVAEHRPEVALLDVQMPGPGPLALFDQVRQACRRTKVVFLSVHTPRDLVRELEARGASAFLSKTVGRDVLSTTIRAAAVGMALRSAADDEATRAEHLTGREIEILRLVARSWSNRRIAQKLFLSESTVKRHLSSTYTKLGASSRVEALSYAIRSGLISGLD